MLLKAILNVNDALKSDSPRINYSIESVLRMGTIKVNELQAHYNFKSFGEGVTNEKSSNRKHKVYPLFL